MDVFASVQRLRVQGVWSLSSFVEQADGRPLFFFWLLFTALWVGDLVPHSKAHSFDVHSAKAFSVFSVVQPSV